MTRRCQTSSGFTLIELLAVVAIIGIITTIAIPNIQNAIHKAREAALMQNLHIMRSVIQQYYADKQRYPSDLQALVRDGYLRNIPVDPFTESSATWRTVQSRSEPLGPDDSGGIWDVHSGAPGIGTNGKPYSEW